MFGNSYAGLNPDEIEVRVWAFVVKAVTILVLGIAFGVLYAIAFEEQAETLAPIDAVFLEILKAVAFMGVGTLGGISGRKAVASYAEKKAEDEEQK
jgi:Na+/serine symporter